MFLKMFVLLFAFIAVAAGKPNSEVTNRYCGFLSFKYEIFQYVVLLRDIDNKFKGTGYIVNADTLITPSGNFKDYNGSIQFTSKTKLQEGERTISANRTYNQFLSVALFDPPLPPEEVKILPRIPILPKNEETSLDIAVMTVGFAKNQERRMIESGLKVCRDNKCRADTKLMITDLNKNCKNKKDTDPAKNDDDNFSDIGPDKYFPQIGDLLVTKDSLVGIMVQFTRNGAISTGEYYFSSYPVGNEFDRAEIAKEPQERDPKDDSKIITFREEIFQYVVLLRGRNDEPKGTGYIVDAGAIITPSVIFRDYKGTILLTTQTKIRGKERRIFANEPYNDFLSVALFRPQLSYGEMSILPTLPILPINEITSLTIPVYTVGFSKDRKRRMISSELIHCRNDICKADTTLMIKNSGVNCNSGRNTNSAGNDDPNCLDIGPDKYFPRVGDVLVTKDSFVGIIIRFERNEALLSGEYYARTHPFQKHLDELQNNKALLEEDKKNAKVVRGIISFGMEVFRYTVLLRDKEGHKGTGYIVTSNAIITPSVIFEDYKEFIRFSMHSKHTHGGRKVFDNTTYNEFLSVAHFSLPLPPAHLAELPRIPIFPKDEILEKDITVMTVGFTGKSDKRLIFTDLEDYKENICYAGSGLRALNYGKNCRGQMKKYVGGNNKAGNRGVKKNPDKDDDEYFPQVGDVLITTGCIVGSMVRFEKKADIVSGEYYTHQYPREDQTLIPKEAPNPST